MDAFERMLFLRFLDGDMVLAELGGVFLPWRVDRPRVWLFYRKLYGGYGCKPGSRELGCRDRPRSTRLSRRR